MKKIYIINILIIVVGITLLISATKDMSTYATFELANNSGKRVKIAGELNKEKDLVYDPAVDPNKFTFHLIDPEGRSNEVLLTKPKPQDFETAEQIVVTGKMEADVFVADEVLMKCPSKYKDEEINLRKQS